MNKLIYVSDPLCGWCYGNSSNILAIKNEFSEVFEFELLMGGMWLPPNTQVGGSSLTQFMKEHAPQMEQTTGQKVSDAFYDLANNPNYTFSSLEGCAASVLVKKLKPEVVFEFASGVQKLFYQKGLPLNSMETYKPLLIDLKVDVDQFEYLWLQEANLNETHEEFNKARHLANGYPTLLIDLNNQIGKISAGYFPLEAMQNHLRQLSKSL
jgi:putative protein-disulfide isomerase